MHVHLQITPAFIAIFSFTLRFYKMRTKILFLFFISVSNLNIILSQSASSINLNFASDSYEIQEEQKDRLQKFITDNVSLSDSIILRGHTDIIGNPEYNLSLSKKRCLTIQSILVDEMKVKNGVASYFHGEELLLSEEETDESHKRNRRVEVIIKKNKPQKQLSFKVYDLNTNEIISSQIVINSSPSSFEIESSEIITTNELPNDKLSITALAKGYYPSIKKMNIKSLKDNLILEFGLRKMVMNSKFPIPDLFFYGGISKLKDSSYPSLESVARLLNINSEVCIELSGHINMPNRPKIKRKSSSFNLSIARAQVVYNYLVEEKIDSSRILVKGYGNHRMIYPFAASSKEESRNRRVEIEIVKCDSIQTIKDDFLSEAELRRQSNQTFTLLFSKKYLNDDLKNFPNKVKRDIIDQVKFLESEGIDPTQYSYSQLLTMFKERVR